MAAASNKPGAVHYALIIFVMLSVILGITTYMFHREYSDRAAAIAKLEGEASTRTATIKTQDDQIQALKKQTGFPFEVVEDVSNPNNATTTLGAVTEAMGKFGKDLAGKTVAETLQKLREALDAATADVASKTAQVATLQKDLNDQRSRLNAQVDTYRKDKEKAETDLRGTISTRDERIQAKQTEIDRLKGDNNQLTGELAQEKEGREKERKKLEQTIAELETRIDIMREKIDELENVSFEVADGLIRRVENASKTVWINLGEADFLKPRMTFSVYAKENQGVGRGAEDVKGKIEVTRVLDAHMAEARIIDEDLYRPMLQGDLIYTPIWSPGLIEKISIIGSIDLDKDGRSDREQFHQMIAVSGAEIDNEVDDNGNRLPEDGKITIQTKFLVLADIPDENTALSDADKEKLAKIRSHLTEMRKEARTNGVRIIKMNDFLGYVGFHSKRRMFRPGDERPFTLKGGATSTAVNEPLGDRSSSGQTSGVFSKKKSAPQQSSSGATSKLFGGKAN